jgi:hypothetical protein
LVDFNLNSIAWDDLISIVSLRIVLNAGSIAWQSSIANRSHFV